MDELISRQAAITIPVMPKEHRHYQTNNLDDAYEQGWSDLQECIENLPPVQPDVPDTNVGDISRQAAMERLMAQNVIMDGSEYHNGFNAGVNRAQEVIRNLPSVQPDHNAEVSKMEIIHCKDCKYYGRADKRRFYRGSDCLNKRIDTIVPDRDFCSRAEKRGEDVDKI